MKSMSINISKKSALTFAYDFAYYFAYARRYCNKSLIFAQISKSISNNQLLLIAKANWAHKHKQKQKEIFLTAENICLGVWSKN
jgi:hypothetical protein